MILGGGGRGGGGLITHPRYIPGWGMILGNRGILGQRGGGLITHPWYIPSLVHPGMGCLPILGSSRDAQGETMGNSGLHGHVPVSLDNPQEFTVSPTFSSTQWTTMDGYFLDSHLKNAGTPIPLRSRLQGELLHVLVQRHLSIYCTPDLYWNSESGMMGTSQLLRRGNFCTYIYLRRLMRS